MIYIIIIINNNNNNHNISSSSLFITFIQGIYNYISETNHVPRL